jgi:hypothetical protein
MGGISALLLLGLAACGGQPTEQACDGFVDYYQALDCTGDLVPLDCSVYRDHPCDATTYFECLEDQFFCDENGDYVDNGFQPCASELDC